MKKMLIAGVLNFGLAVSGAVYAGGNGYGGMGGGNGCGMMGGGYGMMGGGDFDCPRGAGFGPGSMTSENRQKFLDDTTALRKEMNDRRFQYRELMRNPDTHREQLASLEKSMIDLRTKISEKADQYRKASQVQ